MGSLYVCSLKRRLEYPEFQKLVKSYGNLCVLESKLDDYDVTSLNGFSFFFHQTRKQSFLWKSGGILRNQKLTICLDSYSGQFIYLDPISIYIYLSLNRLPIWNSQNCSMFSSYFCCKVITGSLIRIKYLKLRSMAHLLSLECVHCS